MDMFIEFLKSTGVVLAILSPVLLVAWVIKSLKRIPPTHMAIMVIFERAWKFCDSGIHFVPWFFGWNYLIMFPKRVVDLDQREIKVMSATGEYPPGSGNCYNSVEETILGAVYLNFPRQREMLVDAQTGACVCFLKDLNLQQLAEIDTHGFTVYNNVQVALEQEHPLVEVVRAGVPIDKSGLQSWSEKAVNSAVRAVAARKTWRESNENIKDFNREVEEIFRGDADGILIASGFRPSGIRLAIQAVEPPQGVKDAYSGREAAGSVAEKDSEESAGRVLRMVARASGMTVEDLEADLKQSPQKRGKSAADGGYREAFAYAEDQTKRDRAGEGLEDIRVGNVDGTPLEPAIGAIAAMFGLGKREGSRRKKNGGKGGGSSTKKGGKKKNPKDMDDDESLDNALGD